MKKIMSFLAVMLLALCLVGCSDSGSSSSSEATFRIEMGVITNETYYNAMDMISNINSPSKDSIKSVRNYLYQNTVSDYDNSIRGVTSDEIRDFLIQKGISASEANTEVAFMESYGCDIAFFYYTASYEHKVWMYAEKE